MGRIQSSIGLVTGTDIMGTVDQLMAINGRSRDRLIAKNEAQTLERQSIAELTASVIGVQLSGDRLASTALFRSKKAESSLPEALSVTAGAAASAGRHEVRTLQTAATHDVRSLQRFASPETALGFVGRIEIRPGEKLLDESVALSQLHGGRGVEAGRLRITDRSGASADIDLTQAQTMDDVLAAINEADIAVRASTLGKAIQLSDQSGSTLSNLKVEQLGDAETAADLGLWGIDQAADTATGIELVLPSGVQSLRGAGLSELRGGNGLAPLTALDITLSDGSAASIDLSTATTTSEIIDTIKASG
ncbi:MAG: flagellar cap protein FliD N-terminal domain-containing protein, partial [Novipirellula sp. JB048]